MDDCICLLEGSASRLFVVAVPVYTGGSCRFSGMCFIRILMALPQAREAPLGRIPDGRPCTCVPGHSMTGSGLGLEVGVCVHQPGAVSQLRRCIGEAGKAISSQTPGAAVTVRGPGDHVPTGVSVPSTPHPPGTPCGQSPGIPVAS